MNSSAASVCYVASTHSVFHGLITRTPPAVRTSTVTAPSELPDNPPADPEPPAPSTTALIYLSLPTHHQPPIPDRQLHPPRDHRSHNSGPQSPLLEQQLNMARLDACSSRQLFIVLVKVVLETNIAKAILDPTLQHTTTPDHAGRHYIIAEYFAIRRVPQCREPLSLVAPTDSFWSNNASPDIRYSLPLLPSKLI